MLAGSWLEHVGGLLVARFRDAPPAEVSEPAPPDPARIADLVAEIEAAGGCQWWDGDRVVMHPLWPELVATAGITEAMKVRFG